MRLNARACVSDVSDVSVVHTVPSYIHHSQEYIYWSLPSTGNDLWPLLLALTAFPSLISMIILPFMPESPRYLLVNKGDEDGARKGGDLQLFSSHCTNLGRTGCK